MPVEQICKLSRVLVFIVNACKHDVFERESLVRLQSLFKFLASVEYVLERPLFIDRHQLVSQFVSWSGERDCKMWSIRNVCEFKNAWHHAGSRNRHAVGDDVEPMRVSHHAQGLQQ